MKKHPFLLFSEKCWCQDFCYEIRGLLSRKLAWLSSFFVVDSNSPCKDLIFLHGPNMAQKFFAFSSYSSNLVSKALWWVSFPCNSQNTQKVNHSQLIGHPTFNFFYTFTHIYWKFCLVWPQARWCQKPRKSKNLSPVKERSFGENGWQRRIAKNGNKSQYHLGNYWQKPQSLKQNLGTNRGQKRLNEEEELQKFLESPT